MAATTRASRSPRPDWRQRLALERQAAIQRQLEERPEPYEPCSRPDFMSVTPGPECLPGLGAERALRRSPRIEDRVHVTDEQEPRPGANHPRHGADDGRAQAAFRIGVRHDLRSNIRQKPGHECGDLFDPGRGVAAAIDVHEALAIGQVGGSRRGRKPRWPSARRR